ncbi:hypothetical protein F0562_012643 [Nyssa sinensis]|uniref:RING-type E3 ubiquitin transferase n=1 Tax=Nyssa sinensis TaxID=561372 RepID=A0A5J4ZTD6_9ASTE|nr:hypothetical protein F0562_012643 [Nyssa sinensis]
MSTASAHSSTPQSYASPPVTVILTIILLVFFFVGFFSIYFCRCFLENLLYTWNLRRSPSGTPVGPVSSCGGNGLDNLIIQTFPTFTYSSVKDLRQEKYGLECAICLSEFEDENMLRLLTTCCHVFHQECIDLWLESHKTCPVCRRSLETQEKSPEKSPVINNTTVREINEDESIEDAFSITIKDEHGEDYERGGSRETGEEAAALTAAEQIPRDNKVEKFSRSHSTGHSIVRTRGEEDRYTLRLPEHVQAKLMKGRNWTKSCTTFGEFKSETSVGNGGFGELLPQNSGMSSALDGNLLSSVSCWRQQKRLLSPAGDKGGAQIYKSDHFVAMDSPTKSFNANKHLKEQFVSNLTGSSMLELFLLLTILPVLILLRHSFNFNSIFDHDTTEVSLKKNDDAIAGFKNWRAYTMTMLVDFLSIILPFLLFVTVLAEWTHICAIILILLLLLFIAARRFGSSFYLEDGAHSLRSNISSYRVSMMVLTCLCILAVDFKIFPRRYAKTETYGTGLMDLGVGSFVLANSLVSRQARSILKMNLKNTLQSTSPLIFLGFARLASTAGVDYQVHVGEYGVHWNFFFTLAAVSILTSVINVHPQYCGILGSLILIGYQVCLMRGLNVYLLSNERGTHIVSQNKEGIFSIFGYWGMYLVGVQLGSYLFFGNNSNAMLRTNKLARIRVWILCLFFWLLTIVLDRHVERVSRRMCNLAYVTSVLALNLQVLAILMLSPGHKNTVLEEAFNRNLLASFLLANMLTGLVNLCVDTLFASTVSALAILLAYALTLSVTVGLAAFYGIRFKFW